MKIKPTVDYKFQEGLPEHIDNIECFLKSLDSTDHYKTIPPEVAKEELNNNIISQKNTSDLRRLNG